MKKFLILLILFFSCNTNQGPSIIIENAWVRQVPPGSKVSALYFNIKNNGDQSDKLLYLQTNVAEKTEIHNTVYNNDGETAMMVEVDDVEIPAGKTVQLSPGGIHVMLINLDSDLNIGEECQVEAVFENSGTKKFSAKVLESENKMHGMKH